MDKRPRHAPEQKRKDRHAKKAATRRRRILALGALVCVAVAALLVVWHVGGARDVREPQSAAPTASAAPAATPLSTEGIANGATTAPDSAPEVTETAAPTPDAAPTDNPLRTATIRSVGDFVIHDPVFQSAYIKSEKRYDFSPMLSMVSPALSDATLTVANVDGVMRGSKTYAGYPNFDTPPELMTALKDSGVDMLTLANNHALDYYFDGLKATIDNCDAYGLDHIGAARTQAERNAPAIRDLNGIQVGFLDYTQSLNRMEKRSDPGASSYGIIMLEKANFKKDIAALRKAGADVVVVYVHWGTEYQARPDSDQKRYAQEIADAGADVIIGSHPHMIQPATWLKAPNGGTTDGRCLCLYSLGNFLADKRSEQRDTGMIFEFTIEERADGRFAITSPKYIPTYIWRYDKKSGGYDYRVVECGQWLGSERPEGMSAGVQKKVKAAWDYVVKLMGGTAEAITA